MNKESFLSTQTGLRSSTRELLLPCVIFLLMYCSSAQHTGIPLFQYCMCCCSEFGSTAFKWPFDSCVRQTWIFLHKWVGDWSYILVSAWRSLCPCAQLFSVAVRSFTCVLQLLLPIVKRGLKWEDQWWFQLSKEVWVSSWRKSSASHFDFSLALAILFSSRKRVFCSWILSSYFSCTPGGRNQNFALPFAI